ncbi:HAD family hydrolase [Halosolutus amylolyticus]|uniref:HAD family hydrolase n=1 Tax=Halosolutus amylolyticus TaxID=2932267 RepID=A0ABD5PL02_9EURY|nr:HAD family hydrolase [Halosolutus amylolyticus]
MTMRHSTIGNESNTSAVLFDMDGVILEGHGTDSIVHSRALDDVLAARKVTVPDHLRPPLERFEYTDEFVAACETIGVEADEFYALREEHSARRSIDRIQSGRRTLYDDVDVLERLASDRDIALVSNNYDPTVSFVVDHFGLEAFSFVRGRDIGVEGFHRRKPEPYYLEQALGALDVDDGVYVGDRETDLVAAERAGLRPVFIRREHNRSLELEHETAVEIQSLDELRDLV